MSKFPLKLLSQPVLNQLAESIPANLKLYKTDGFSELALESGWEIETTHAKWNPAIVEEIDFSTGPEAEIKNSLLVFKSFVGMTPALAREERLWARLCHIEFLEFARQRWLNGVDDVENQAKLHFFAPGFPGCRDDNAIGRLWWNGYVASLACPTDIELGLRLLLKRANIRLQIIDRADTAFRKPLIQGIVRLLEQEAWFDSFDAAIANFMFEVNKRSGSVVFEAMSEHAVDDHLAMCLQHAQNR